MQPYMKQPELHARGFEVFEEGIPLRLTVPMPPSVPLLFPSVTESRPGSCFRDCASKKSSISSFVKGVGRLSRAPLTSGTPTLTFTSPMSQQEFWTSRFSRQRHTGSGMKNGKLKSKDFFGTSKQDPSITFLSKRLYKPAPIPFDVQVTL